MINDWLCHLSPITRSVLAIMVVLCLLLGSQGNAEGKKRKRPRQPIPAVLTLEEVARFFRVKPSTIARLARKHQIPGRLIGGHWRFSRLAILQWLKNRGPHRSGKAPPGRYSKPKLPPNPQSLDSKNPQPQGMQLDHEFISGRAISTRSPDAKISSDREQEPETIGEKPELQTAEETVLRDQDVLLEQDQATVELGFFFSKSDQQGLAVIPLNSQFVLASAAGDQDLYIWNLTVRYGLPYDIQFFSAIPLLRQENEVSTTVPGTSITQRTSNTLTELGNLALGFRRTVVEEGVGWPSVILSLSGQIPTRHRSFGISGGFSLVKQIDPVALFAGINYNHIFSREFQDTSRLEPESIVSGQMGYVLSLNDTIAISTSVSGTFTLRKTFDNPSLPSIPASERFRLRLALTALLDQNLYVEPSLSFSLNGPSSVTLGLSLPYTFDIPTF